MPCRPLGEPDLLTVDPYTANISGARTNDVEDTVKLEEIGDLALKGLSQAVAVYNVVE